MYKAGKGRNEILCSYCSQNHSAFNTCVELCIYCKSVHKKTDLVEGMCPRMAGFAKSLQSKESIPCQCCLHPEEMEKAATEILMQQLKGLELLSGQECRTLEITSVVECGRCLGKKYLPRLIKCCKNGCIECGFQKMIINPKVKEEHMRYKTCQEPFECSICLDTVAKGEKIFRYECNHSFHYLCIYNWLMENKSCPYCRQEDMFLDVGHEYLMQVKQVRKEMGEIEETRIHINSEGEIVEGDNLSQFSDDDAYDEYDWGNGLDDLIQ